MPVEGGRAVSASMNPSRAVCARGSPVSMPPVLSPGAVKGLPVQRERPPLPGATDRNTSLQGRGGASRGARNEEGGRVQGAGLERDALVPPSGTAQSLSAPFHGRGMRGSEIRKLLKPDTRNRFFLAVSESELLLGHLRFPGLRFRYQLEALRLFRCK
ncbi:hypothetical protein NDU88_001108 [Pleurodeles waltl]|uniref:Uncharacterized protein n=1 Tax=Pleurodeles waltl TaxID=8319 RepID=A0AAV7W039_PLEWA|nr:hypothetical protein NDU88_001108 [Pleurodeles waltl]